MPRNPEQLRRKVLDASIELVAEQGVRAVSFREVARRAGVSHQTPYHHFGNHRGILRAIAAEGFASLTAAMAEAGKNAVEGGGDAVDALEQAGVAYVRFAVDHVGHFRVMFQKTLVEGHEDEEPVEEGEETYATLVQMATSVHAAGFGHGTSIDSIAHIAWSTVHGLSTLMIEGKLPIDDEAVRRAVGDFSAMFRR